jgi:hypothetical protein
MTDTDIHSCGYYCDRPVCIVAQRNELRDKLFSNQAVKTYEQEPQGTIAKWIKANTEHRQWYICPKCSYQAPRFKDEWVGLTDDEIKTAWSQLWYDLNNGKFAASDDPSRHTNVMFARAIEAKLKEKNT